MLQNRHARKLRNLKNSLKGNVSKECDEDWERILSKAADEIDHLEKEHRALLDKLQQMFDLKTDDFF